MNGTCTIIAGDATKPAGLGDDPIVIPHCCNSDGLWGAGFVLAINKAFGSKPMEHYKHWHDTIDWIGPEKGVLIDSPYKKKFMLGAVQFVKLPNKLVIANMIGQQGVYAGPNTRPPIRYGAISTAMQAVAKFTNAFKAEIHCPMFGSDLAGGDWNVILQLIEELWLDEGIDVTVYEFPKR